MQKLAISIFFVLLGLLLACQTKTIEHDSTIKIPIDSLSSVRTDFMSLVVEQETELLLLKNQIRNTIDIFDLGKGEKVSTIYFNRHKSSAGEIQSANYLNSDTILVLKKNTPVLYFFNRYGHLYHRWSLPEKELIHFSITTNPPIVYKTKLYISILQAEMAQPMVDDYKLKAFEYVIDYRTGESHLVTLQLDDSTGRTPYGLRHRIATRVLANGKLFYVWGGNKKVLIYDLDTKESIFSDLPVDLIELEPFNHEYTDHKGQQEYYFKNTIIDHMSFDEYRNVFYLYILAPNLDARHKYQRVFKILMLDKNFGLLKEIKLIANTYLFDHELITESGLFLATNNPFNPAASYDSLSFKRIEFD